MSRIRRIPVRTMITAVSLAVLAGCATPPPPPPPPPPAPTPTPTPVPARPQAPEGAHYNMPVPPIDAYGVRQTVNANLTSAQTVWNFRSAMNVAALNCLRPGDEPILDAYKDLLKSFARPLSATNRALDDEFRKKYGSAFHSVRDQYMTQVYNYFALPPVLGDFCDEALQISQTYLQARPDNLDVFAASALPQLEARFVHFFGDYERWRTEVAAWDAQYGDRYGYIYPAYVEAHSNPAPETPAIQIAGLPVSATGAAVIDAPAQPASGPVVQPTSGPVVQPAPGLSTQPPPGAAAATGQAVVQPLPGALPDAAQDLSAYGPVSPQVQTVVEPAPSPVFSLPPEARADAEPQFTSRPVTQPVAEPGFGPSLAGSEQAAATVSQPVVQPTGDDAANVQ